MSELTRENYVAGLRAAADFYQQHPEIALPSTYGANISNFQLRTKEEAVAVAKAFGSCSKNYYSSILFIGKEIVPGFELRFIFSREKICERFVVSTKVIPAHTIPAKEVPEEIVEEVEWHCTPLLAETNTSALPDAPVEVTHGS